MSQFNEADRPDTGPAQSAALSHASSRPRVTSASLVAGSLSPQLLGQATRRLSTAALVWAALWSLALIMNSIIAPLLSPEGTLDDAWPLPGAPVAGGVIVTSLALYLLNHRGNVAPGRVLDLGLGYELVLAFAIGLVNQWTPNTTGLSWICVLVLVFPYIVPNTPLKTLAAALAAASMDGVGMAITAARGELMPPASVLVWALLPNYICALLAVIPSQLMRRLGQQASRAQHLGGYQVADFLGAGGMGEVYRATHDVLSRPAAIKLIRPELLGASSPESVRTLVERFVREADAVAMLTSPHTIDLYDFGIAEDGTLFHVMELLDGIDLDTLVRTHGPVSPARTRHILAQMCSSLAEAHSRGLVHRDIKPANIQLCRHGLEVDHVKVMDFGLVKQRDPRSRCDLSLTCPNVVMGTPAYMAPELILDNSVDGRADIYALGCVGYWLLTGRPVFDGKTVVSIAVQHLHSVPEPPSRVSGQPIPRGLEDLIMACLAKDPLDRPQSMVDVERQLRSLTLDCSWTEAHARRWWRLHRPSNEGPATRSTCLQEPSMAVA